MPNDKINTMQEDEKLVFEEEFSGEPTTADEHNKVYISDVNKEIVDEMNESIKGTPEYRLGKKVISSWLDVRIDPLRKDLLKLMDKLDTLEQMITNHHYDYRNEYRLVNDRIDEAFDIFKMIEREK